MIYIMAHNKADLKLFYCDNFFDKKMFKFFLTEGSPLYKNEEKTKNLIKYIENNEFKTILEWKLQNYNPTLQKNKFLAPSIFYHCHINNFLENENLSYIGFLEYDLKFELDKNIANKLNQNFNFDNFSFTKEIKRKINENKNEKFVIFPSIRHTLSSLEKDSYITMKGVHWMRFFLNDYNTRFNVSIDYDNFLKKHQNELIPTQQSFICDIETFKNLCQYVFNFIEDYGYNTENEYSPRPATILDRCIGMFLFIKSLNYKNKYFIPLIHNHLSGGKY